MQCTQFLVVYINRFCEYTIVNMYLLIIYYVRSMFHFGKEREEKSEKISKSQGFFHQKKKKKKRGCHKKIFQETEKKNNIYHLCTLPKTLCMEILCAWNVKTVDILIWRIRNIFMHKMWTFLCPMWIIIPRNDIFR